MTFSGYVILSKSSSSCATLTRVVTKPLLLLCSLSFAWYAITSVWEVSRGWVCGNDLAFALLWPLIVVVGLSLDVIQWRTSTENKISQLQHIRQTQPGSPLRAATNVRLLYEISTNTRKSSHFTNTTLETNVAQLPMNVLRATVRTPEARLF